MNAARPPRLLCYPYFGTNMYVQGVKLAQKKKQTMLPQLKLPSTASPYKAKVYLYVFVLFCFVLFTIRNSMA